MVDSICRAWRDCRDSARRFYGWDANAPIFSSPLLIRSRNACCSGWRGSPICLRARPGRTSCCWSPASSWRQAGAPSRRRCASWDEITTPASALSTVSSTARVVVPGGGGPAVDPADQGLCAVRRAGRDRDRRHHRAALGSQDQCPRHLSRSGPSSKGHFVKASGLRWLSAMLLVRVPWAGRIMALPFLTLLAPSKRFYAGKSRAPKTLLDWAARLPCKSAAGSLIALLSWSPTARSRQSNFSPPSAPMSASSPACGSTPICSASRRKSAKAAAGHRAKASL